MFCHKGSELAIGISIERPMLSGMHLVFPSRLVVVQLLQFVVLITWVVDLLSRVSLLHNVKWLWCFLLFSALASEACYLLGGSGDCWRRAACGSFHCPFSSWWWCWWCRQWFGGCAWWPGERRWFRGCWRIRGRLRQWRRVESGDVDPNPEPSRKRVRGQDIPRRRKRATFDVSLDDSGLQTYFEEEFPSLPTQSPFCIWSEIFPPTLVDHIVEQTCMQSATAIFLLFRLAAKIFCPYLASFFCWAIIIFPKNTIIGRTVKTSASQLFQRQWAGQVFATSSATFTLRTTTTWSKATKLRRLLQFTPVLTPPLPNLECSTKICRLMDRWCHTLGAHSAKMFIRGKPIRFGYTVWSISGSDGYPPPASLQRQRGNIQQRAPRHEGRQSHGWSCSGEFWCCRAPLLLRQLLHIPQAPFRLGIRESESYWHSEGKPDRRSKPWFDVHQSNEKEHTWNNRLLLWWHRVHVQVERQLGHHCCKQLPNPLSSVWSAKACERTAGQQCPAAAPYPRLQSRNGWCWPHGPDGGIIQAIDSWEEMVLATVYECVERDCSGVMVDPLQDRWVFDVTSRLLTGECSLFAEDIHGQSFASWRWTAGQPCDDVGFDGEDHKKVAASQGRCKVCKNIAVTCVQSATCGCTMTASQNAMSPTTWAVDSLNNSLKSWRFSAQWSSKTLRPTSVWLEQNKFHLNLCVETPLSKFFVHTFFV